MKLRDGVPASVLVDMARALAAGPPLTEPAAPARATVALAGAAGSATGCQSQPFMLGVAARECNRARALAVSRRLERGSAISCACGRRRGGAAASVRFAFPLVRVGHTHWPCSGDVPKRTTLRGGQVRVGLPAAPSAENWRNRTPGRRAS